MVRILIILLVLCVACGHSKNEQINSSAYSVDYSSTFHFEFVDSVEYLVVDKPWPKSTESKKYALNKPLKKIVCTSTSHLPYFEMLGIEDAVIGFPNMDYVSSKLFRERAEKGLIVDMGLGGSLNIELLIGLQPDAVIVFDSGSQSSLLNQIENLGIPIIYNSDFLEQTPLGRAEWIKAFGALFDKKTEADSIFLSIEKKYNYLQNLTKNVKKRPTIFSGVVYGDTWYLPGGKNWSATFFKNAGGEYLWAHDTTSGWLKLSFEAVYEVANDADFWIGASMFESRAEMINQEDRYNLFNALKANNVYSYKKNELNGGIDFFESGYSRPDLVLSDIIKIIHPELLPDYEKVYFKQL